MNPRIKSKALLLLAFLMNGNNLHATELTNSKILGAIPSTFDNIGIVRYIDMDAGTVVGSEFLRGVPAAMPPPPSALPVANYIAERLNLDGLSIAAVALSNDDVSASMDSTGRRNFRLYVADHDTGRLRQTIASRPDIEPVDHADYDVYRDNTPGNPTFVAFLNETLLLVTSNEEDINVSGPALLAQDAQPAPNWSILSAVEIDAPVLILRHLQYPMVPPPGADVPHHEDFVLGMWISDTSAPVFQIEASTDLGHEAAEHYIRTVGAIEAVAGPDGIAFSLDQPVAGNDNYPGSLELLHSELGDHYTDLIYVWLLGIWFTI